MHPARCAGQPKSRLRRQGRVPGRSDTENRVCCDAGSGSPAKKPLEQRPQRPNGSVGGDGVRIHRTQAPVTGPVHRFDARRYHAPGIVSSRPCMEVAHRKVTANRGGTTGPTPLVPSQEGDGGVFRIPGHPRSDARPDSVGSPGSVFAVEASVHVSSTLVTPGSNPHPHREARRLSGVRSPLRLQITLWPRPFRLGASVSFVHPDAVWSLLTWLLSIPPRPSPFPAPGLP